jgi:hypothetical protein
MTERARKLTPSSASEWAAALPTWFGMMGLIACFVVWVATSDHIVEPIFVTTFGGLLGVGQAANALVVLKRPPEAPSTQTPTPDPIPTEDRA